MCTKRWVTFTKCGHVVKWIEYCKYCPPGSTSDKCQSPKEPRIVRTKPLEKECCCDDICCGTHRQEIEKEVADAEKALHDFRMMQPLWNPAYNRPPQLDRLEMTVHDTRERLAWFRTRHADCRETRIWLEIWLPGQGPSWDGIRTGEQSTWFWKCDHAYT